MTTSEGRRRQAAAAMGHTHYAAISSLTGHHSGETTIACYAQGMTPRELRRRMAEPRVRGPVIADGIEAVANQVTCPDCMIAMSVLP